MCSHADNCDHCGYLAYFYERVSDAFTINEYELRKEYRKLKGINEYGDCSGCGKANTPLWKCERCQDDNCGECKEVHTCQTCGLTGCRWCVFECEHCKYFLCSKCVDLLPLSSAHIF